MSHLTRLLRKPLLPLAALLLLSACMFVPGLGNGVVSRESELRVLLCARKMAEGGSWLVPNFLGQERLRKPPLMYWIAASAFQLRGSTEDAGAARAAAAAAATALVLATYLGGRHLIGRRAAFFAAFVLATSIGFFRHARLAETDMPQALFTSLAIFCAYFALSTSRPLRWWTACGVAMGTGFMFKGPASLAMPLAAIIVFVLCERLGASGARRMRAVKDGLSKLRLRVSWPGILIALVLFVAIVAPWYIAVALRTTDSTTSQATDELSRLLIESHHEEPFYYYLHMLPLRLGGWGLLIPVALWAAVRCSRHHRGMALLLAWFGSSFVILSALQSKQQHYALLLLPPSALLCGWLLARASRLPTAGKFLSEQFQSLEKRARAVRGNLPARFARGYVRWFCILPAIAGALVLASHLVRIPGEFVEMRAELTPVAVAGIIVGAASFRFVRGQIAAGLTVIAAVHVLIVAAQSLSLERHTNGLTVVRELLGRNREAVKTAGTFHVAGPRASVVAWYAGRDITFYDATNAAAVWRGITPGDVLIASDKADKPRIAPQIPVQPDDLGAREHFRFSLYQKPRSSP